MNLVDTRLNITDQALALLQLLAQEEVPANVWTTTSALYNGRERGICLSLSATHRDHRIFIFWSESRNSDQLVIVSWEGRGDINPPTIADVPEAAWDDWKHFPFGRIDLARTHILELVAQYLKGGAS